MNLTEEDVRILDKLADVHPRELGYFKKIFLWDGSLKGCYIRRFYEYKNLDGLKIQKWQPLTSKGNYQPLYATLVDELAEKHLDFERFQITHRGKERLISPNWETAFWVGTMAGLRTSTHAIDIDLHDQIGWYCVPTRWHSSQSGSVDGPHSYRDLPVPRPNLRFYQTAKLIYDSFPHRIWCFSSGSLGLAVWQRFKKAELTQIVHRKMTAKLEAVGLAHIEHYPLPPSPSAKLGRCHRRPCGMDSALITPDGLLTDPIEQIRWFMKPEGTPSFIQIVQEHIRALMHSYRAFLACGEANDHTRLSRPQKVELIKECWKVVEEVKVWMGNGCPIDKALIASQQRKTPHHSELGTFLLNSTEEEGMDIREEETLVSENTSPSDLFWRADLPAIVEAGQWLQFVKFVVENGIPAEDKLFDIVSTLAKWFLFVEFYGRDKAETVEVLRTFVLTKHNGNVSRLRSSELHDVLEQVARIVAHVARSSEAGSSFFENLRRKRATGKYGHVWNFGPKLLAGSQADFLQAALPGETLEVCDPATLQVSSANTDKSWQYVPDDTALPDFAVERIREAFRRANRQIRKVKGEYPLIKAVTRFVNFLLSGRKLGQRRCSRMLLKEMGFNTRGTDVEQVIKILVGAKLVIRGDYKPHSRSTLWTLCNAEQYESHRNVPISLANTISSLPVIPFLDLKVSDT